MNFPSRRWLILKFVEKLKRNFFNLNFYEKNHFDYLLEINFSLIADLEISRINRISGIG